MFTKRGFTLVEIMVVVAIIGTLAAIAIPNFLRARVTANEAAAVAGLKTIVTAMDSWRSSNGAFSGASLNALGNATPPYIDGKLGCAVPPCSKTGYSFSDITVGTDNQTYYLTASPVTANVTGVRYFCTTDDGVVRYGSAVPANRSACQALSSVQ